MAPSASAIPGPSVTKDQRLVNLVIALMSTSAYLSGDQLRRMVQGYEDCASEQAFRRRFERDKKELREAGVPIEQGDSVMPGSPTGYRVSPADYRLPEITLTPEQAGVLGVAARVWRDGERAAAANGALAKLSAAGLEPAGDPTVALEVDDPRELGVAAALAEATATGLVVTFDHTPVGAASPTRRRVEPWWTGSRDGHWYLVGHDLDRAAPRVFRLVRVGEVVAGPEHRAHPVPPADRAVAALDEALANVNPDVEAQVWVAAGRAAELRSRALSEEPEDRGGMPGSRLRVRGPASEIVALVAGQGAHAVALVPEDLRARVVDVLTAATGGAR